MRKALSTLFCAWILWGSHTSGGVWMAYQGFKTLDGCLRTQVDGMTMKNKNPKITYHCFPSDFSPRK